MTTVFVSRDNKMIQWVCLLPVFLQLLYEIDS